MPRSCNWLGERSANPAFICRSSRRESAGNHDNVTGAAELSPFDAAAEPRRNSIGAGRHLRLGFQQMVEIFVGIGEFAFAGADPAAHGNAGLVHGLGAA